MFESGIGKKLVAEYLGAFILTAAVVFPAIALRNAGLGAFLFIMFTAGLGMALVTWLFRDVSGAHVNPAVTFAMMVLKKTSIVTGVLYWIVQMAGAMGAVLYAKATFMIEGSSAADLGNLGAALPTPDYQNYQVMMAEAIGVFLLVSVVLAVLHVKDKVQAGLAIGFALLIGIVMTAPISGGALNPARAFASIIAADVYQQSHLLFYIVAPFIGALVAVIVYLFFEGERWSLDFLKLKASRVK